MSKAITFDTLQYAKKLKNAGLSDELAEIQAEALKELIENNLATKSDIRELKRDIEMIKKDLIIQVGGMLVAAIGVLTVVLTILGKVHY